MLHVCRLVSHDINKLFFSSENEIKLETAANTIFLQDYNRCTCVNIILKCSNNQNRLNSFPAEQKNIILESITETPVLGHIPLGFIG